MTAAGAGVDALREALFGAGEPAVASADGGERLEFACLPAQIQPGSPDVWDRAMDACLFELLDQAGLDHDAIRAPTTGSVIGATIGRLPRRGIRGGGWSVDLQAVAEQTAVEPLRQRWGLGGPHWTLNAACASTTVAIGTAAELVRSCVVDRALVGAMEVLNEFDAAGFRTARLWDARACRPFDRGTSAIMLGEGGGLLLLEAEPSRRPLGEVLGWASANEAYDLARPEPSGAALAECIHDCLARAGLAPDDVDYVNAHGTGSRANDVSEARALSRVWRTARRSPLVSGTKRLHGHLRAACGVVEAMVCLLALREGEAPPTFGCREPLPECRFELVLGSPERRAIRTALSISRGFGGVNAVLALGEGAGG